MAPRSSVIHQGRLFLTVAEAAKRLSTTQAKIRALMGDGSLEWDQLRMGGAIMILAESLYDFKRRKAGLANPVAT